ncbi:MAG TPA: hypothetical protein VFG20_19890 [Planctomycetaceae bacterium]|nr:hypothetical protein [Planctomycetaceae bacterium]
MMLRAGIIGMTIATALSAAPPSVRQITNDGLLKQRPNWSPDGQHVVFARHRGSTIFLFVRNIVTGNEERLTMPETPEFDAVFAPDGKSLLFTFDKVSPGQGDMEVHRITWMERTPTPMAISRKGLSHEESPAWSPTGKRFAFSSTYQGNQEIYAADIDGEEWMRLTDDVATDAHPAWSPDGKTIAFATSRWGNFEIALMDPDGGNLRRFTSSFGLDDYPCWSPDGKLLAWVSNRDGNLEIYVQDTAGSQPPRNVTENAAIDNFPAWTPDGRLSLISDRGDGFELYVTERPFSP